MFGGLTAAIVALPLALAFGVQSGMGAIGTIVATFVLAGIFMIIMGLSRIGQYIRYMPYPVIFN